MSDLDDEAGNEEPTEHAWVSRLLAETPREPLPDQVTARLDAALADLTEASRPQPEPARTQFEAARTADHPERSIGRIARVALAVAAGVVLVAGGAFMTTRLPLPTGISGGGGGTAADSSASQPAPPSTSSGGTSGGASEGAAGGEAFGPSGDVVTLTRSGFATQVRTVLRDDVAGDRPDSPEATGGEAKPRAQAAPLGCSPPTPSGVDRTLPARLDGRPVVLQVSITGPDRQLVRAVACDGTTLVSASVPRS